MAADRARIANARERGELGIMSPDSYLGFLMPPTIFPHPERSKASSKGAGLYRSRLRYAPAIVIPSMRKVGASVPVLKMRSFAGVRCRNISFRLLAMVSSLTG